MKRITTKQIRPALLVSIFWEWLVFADQYNPNTPEDSSSIAIITVATLLAALIFRIKESIFIKNEVLTLGLQNCTARITISQIKDLHLSERLNTLKIETNESFMTFKIHRFNQSILKHFFIVNKLYNPGDRHTHEST